MTAVMEETMMRSAIGPALAMYVAEHPEEATRISQIPDTFAQAIEIVRLEAHPDVVALAEKAWPDGEPAAVVTCCSTQIRRRASPLLPLGASPPPSNHVAHCSSRPNETGEGNGRQSPRSFRYDRNRGCRRIHPGK